MVRRIVVSAVSCCFVAACGASPPPTPAAVPAPATGKGDGAPVSKAPNAPRRGASDSLRRAWSFEKPTVVAYADFSGLMHTNMMSDLAKSVVAMTATFGATPVQKKCLEDAFANLQQVALGTDGNETLVVARVGPSTTHWVGACLLAIFPSSTTTRVPGATEAWANEPDITAMSPEGLLFLGPRGLVERGLAARSSGASLAAVTLGDGEYVTWTATIFPGQPPSNGSLLATDDRFRIAGEADLPNEQMAQRIEHELAAVNIPFFGTPETAEAVARLVKAFSVKRDGSHVAVALDLHEPPAQQAQDLGAAAALAIFGVRTYLIKAKQAEAKNTLGQLARNVAMAWEAEAADGKQQSERRLVSYPPVPKTVPKGVKYHSSPADWKAWAPLRFEMGPPQYYQYEIKAGKGGQSAEVIARGDLNGDGKASQFKMSLKIERSSNHIWISPSIEETDPDE